MVLLTFEMSDVDWATGGGWWFSSAEERETLTCGSEVW